MNKYLIRPFQLALDYHYRALIVPLNFVRHSSDRKLNEIKVKRHYQFELSFLICAIFLGTIGLVYESDAEDFGKKDLFNVLVESPTMFVHQAFARASNCNYIWLVTDPVIAIMMTYMILVAGVSCFNGQLESRFCMTESLESDHLKIDRKKLTLQDSTNILAFYRKANCARTVFMKTFYPILIMFCYVNVLVNAAYKLTIFSFIYWVCIFPLLLFYIVFEMLAKVIFVLATAEYICIRQRSVHETLAKLNARIVKCHMKKTNKYFTRIWSKYKRKNLELARICRHLQAYDRFWLPYLTLTIVNYTTYESFVANSVLFTDSVSFDVKLYFAFCIANVGLLHYSLIRQCSKVVKRNQAIARENCKFCNKLLFCKIVNKLQISEMHLLKAESNQVPGLLRGYAFHLFGNYRITTKSLHVALSYVSVLFFWFTKYQRKLKYSTGHNQEEN